MGHLGNQHYKSPQQAISLLLFVTAFGVSSRVECRAEEPAKSPFLNRLVFFNNQSNLIDTTDFEGCDARTIYEAEKNQAVLFGRVAPDGHSVAFIVSSGPQGNGRLLILLNADGISHTIAEDVDQVACWSPDSKKLIYHRSNEKSPFPFYVMDLATAESEQLAVPGQDSIFDWSPTNRTLCAMAGNPSKVFKSDNGERYPQRELISVSLAGNRIRSITHDPEGDYIWARFSPDGLKLAYYRRVYHNGKPTESAVVADADGANPRDLVCFTTLDDKVLIRPHGGPCMLAARR